MKTLEILDRVRAAMAETIAKGDKDLTAQQMLALVLVQKDAIVELQREITDLKLKWRYKDRLTRGEK